MSVRSAARVSAAALVAAAALAPSLAGAAPSGPKIRQLVVFRSGSAKQASVVASQTSVRVGGRSCTVGAGTALAALARSGAGKLTLKDFGSCSRRAADAAQIYVRAIGRDSAKGVDGWVYKVGNKAATAGAGDVGGPFGNGRLKSGARVTWFYCHMNPSTHSCQRTLAISPQALGGGRLKVTVRGFDDRGRGAPDAGATVRAGAASAQTGADGTAILSLAPGRVGIRAEHAGEVRSFEEAVQVR